MKKTEHYLYKTWCDLRHRCNSPYSTGYKYYGGRGIKVCQRWLDDFWNFVEDMGDRPEGHSIERRDNNKGYSADNCYWGTSQEQNLNRRPFRMKGAKGYTKLPSGKYFARIWVKDKNINLGAFDCPLMAHLAFRDAKQKYQPA